MSNLLMDKVIRLLTEYTFNVDTDSTNEDLFCCLCYNLMKEACKANCGCQYCYGCIVIYLADGRSYCQGQGEECHKEYLTLENNVFRSSLLDKKVSKVKVHCPNEFCQSITELQEMEEHLKICVQQFTEVSSKLVHSQLMIELFNTLKDELIALREIQRNEKVESDNLKMKLETEIKYLKDELKRTKTITTSFTVDRFSSRKIFVKYINSHCFYSHMNGYKLQLKVYLKGCAVDKGTHLSVYIVICKGEYDNILPWPCRHTFTLSIVNQRGGMYASQTFNYAIVPDNLRYVFDKPINKDNGEYGYPKFVSHADLRNVIGLVVNDSVIVRCTVSDST